MKKHLLLALTLVLAGCVRGPDLKPHDWAMDVQTAETREAHDNLADHYEDIARTMDADAAEERRMLDKYITSPHKYGKQIQDIKGRSNAMIRDFGMAAAESRKMAAYHRQLANAASKP